MWNVESRCGWWLGDDGDKGGRGESLKSTMTDNKFI